MIWDAVLQFDKNIVEKNQMFYAEIQLLDLLFSVIALHLFGFVRELKMKKKKIGQTHKTEVEVNTMMTIKWHTERNETFFVFEMSMLMFKKSWKILFNLNSINLRIFIELIEHLKINHRNEWFKYDLFFSIFNESKKKRNCPCHNEDFPTIFFSIVKMSTILPRRNVYPSLIHSLSNMIYSL